MKTATKTKTPKPRVALAFNPPIAQITLVNPPLNVLDLPMMRELSSALAEIEARSDISVVVLSGQGQSFSAGVEVAAHTPDKAAAMLTGFHAIIRVLISTTKVTVAAVQGNCMGGGAELAMVCDVVITTEDAQWRFPEIKLGCFPPVAATALSTLVGQKLAADLILTGRMISGKQAAEAGLATRSILGDELKTVMNEVTGQLAGLSPAALALAKKAIYAWDSMHFDKGLARSEKIYLEELLQTEDAEEGIRAFLEKRNPVWKGR
jgi:cyclohexa-1,5-dienecarbonyl-CoA hydratase